MDGAVHSWSQELLCCACPAVYPARLHAKTQTIPRMTSLGWNSAVFSHIQRPGQTATPVRPRDVGALTIPFMSIFWCADALGPRWPQTVGPCQGYPFPERAPPRSSPLTYNPASRAHPAFSRGSRFRPSLPGQSPQGQAQPTGTHLRPRTLRDRATRPVPACSPCPTRSSADARKALAHTPLAPLPRPTPWPCSDACVPRTRMSGSHLAWSQALVPVDR